MDALRAQDPARIGDYVLLARLGAGGMGQVYLGRSPGGRLVAIKVIREEITGHPEALARFRREAETVRAVRGAYTANLIDAGLDAPPYWLATEYVAGPTLGHAVGERGAFPVDTARKLFAAMAEGLASVHAYGVTHRDLKPQNVLLAAQGPQLIDFGIARGVTQTALTQDGVAPGTPGYSAPEVLMHNDVGAPADVFALGATIAYAATGRPPFGVGEAAAVSYRAVHEQVDVAGVEPGLAALIQLCVAKDPARRPSLTEIIRRCDVDAALVDDAVYRPLVGLGDVVPQAPQRLSDLPTVGPRPAYTPTYVPTEGAAALTSESPRRRSVPWLTAAGVGLVVGVAAISLALLLQGEGDSGDGDKGAREGGPSDTSKSPGATGTSSPSDGEKGPPEAPQYVEQTNPSRDLWTPDDWAGRCNLPAEEKMEPFQMSVADIDNPDAQVLSGKLRIGFRLKFVPAGMKETEPYYVSVAVKPPHELPGTSQENLSLGFSSKPVDIFAKDPTKMVDLTYPDDFGLVVNGEKSGNPPAVEDDPGNWTLLYHHVISTKEYRSIACHGFVGE